MKNPWNLFFVARKKYDDMYDRLYLRISGHVKELEELELVKIKLLSENSRLKENIKAANAIIDEVVPKLIGIEDMELNPIFDEYRICTSISRQAVEAAFLHGDDIYMHYLSDRFANQIKRKMIQYNFWRRP